MHAPYIVNVATTNNRIRIPSRKLLQQHVDAAAAIGAKGLIVHGGHVNKDDDPAKGFDNWRKAVEATDLKLPLLIENTAGGDNAMTRYLERIAGVWDAISTAEGFDMVGFCLDTCHAHAGGNDLSTVVEDVVKITGTIDLVHCNDSRDDFDSGADRHANFGNGRIAPRTSPPSSATPALRSCARRRVAPTSTGRTSPSCASGCDAGRVARHPPLPAGRRRRRAARRLLRHRPVALHRDVLTVTLVAVAHPAPLRSRRAAVR